MQGAPTTLEGFRKPRAHEGVPVTAGGKGELAWAFVKVVGAVPALIAVIWGASAIGAHEGGFADIRARLQLVSINQTLGYNDPMRYLEIIGPWVAIGFSLLVLWMLINRGFSDGAATLGKANKKAEQEDRNRRWGVPGY